MSSTGLSAPEASRLAHLEKIVESGINASREAGEALLEIRDKNLYRSNHESFRDYVEKRWSCGKAYANRLISAAETRERIMAKVSDKQVAKDMGERQLRELTNVPDKKLDAVMSRAMEIAKGEGKSSPVAAMLKKARNEIAPSKPVIPPAPVGATCQMDPAAEKSKAKIPDLIRKLRFQLGNIGKIRKWDAILDQILEDCK